jgi:hypothetical protein
MAARYEARISVFETPERTRSSAAMASVTEDNARSSWPACRLPRDAEERQAGHPVADRPRDLRGLAGLSIASDVPPPSAGVRQIGERDRLSRRSPLAPRSSTARVSASFTAPRRRRRIGAADAVSVSPGPAITDRCRGGAEFRCVSASSGSPSSVAARPRKVSESASPARSLTARRSGSAARVSRARPSRLGSTGTDVGQRQRLASPIADFAEQREARRYCSGCRPVRHIGARFPMLLRTQPGGLDPAA